MPSGSTPSDVFYTSCLIVFGASALHWLRGWDKLQRRKSTGAVVCFSPSVSRILCEWIVLLAACFMMMAPKWLTWSAAGAVVGQHVVLTASLLRAKSANQTSSCEETFSDTSETFSDALSNFSGAVMFLTWFCILFADCADFPPDMQKTQDFGISLMDVGVASAVYVLGLRCGLRNYPPHKTALRACLLAILGAGRMLLVSVTGYHQPVTEYGTHWNFLLSVSVILFLWVGVKFALRWLFPRAERGSWACLLLLSALATLSWHEGVTLWSLGLAQTVMSPARDTLLESNKEGLVSLGGYFALFLLAAGTAAATARQRSDRGTSLVLGAIAVCCCVASAILMQLLDSLPSRRLCNASYVMYCAAANTIVAWMFFALSTKKKPSWPTRNKQQHDVAEGRGSILLVAVSRHQLVGFLVSNLLTGLLNISLNLRQLSSRTAALTIASYMGFCSAFAVLLD
jgi:phosphatidylinositol glycan class W